MENQPYTKETKVTHCSSPDDGKTAPWWDYFDIFYKVLKSVALRHVSFWKYYYDRFKVGKLLKHKEVKGEGRAQLLSISG